MSHYSDWVARSVAELRALPGCDRPVLDAALDIALKYGTWVEFGVADGVTLRRIVEAKGDAHVWGFDTFTGLPEEWKRTDNMQGVFKPGHFAVDRIPVIAGAHLVTGLFQETLPAWMPREDVTFVHIDCDLYSATSCALQHLMAMVTQGTIIVFDELFNYGGFEDNEMKALYEAHVQGLEWDWILVRGGPDSYPNESAAIRVKNHE